MYNSITMLRLWWIRDRLFKYISVVIHQIYDLFVFIEPAYPKLDYKRSLVGMSARMAAEVISIQDGGGMLTSSIRRAHSVRTKVGRLRKHSVLKSDWFSVILPIL